jgi:predicted small metal-binding protein
MTTQEIRILSTDEKVRIMAAIWEDMRDHYEETPISEELINLLKERQSRVDRSEALLLDWDKVKFAIGRG